MNRNLTGRVALVTGSVYGIDLAMAKERLRPLLQSLNITQSCFCSLAFIFSTLPSLSASAQRGLSAKFLIFRKSSRSSRGYERAFSILMLL